MARPHAELRIRPFAREIEPCDLIGYRLSRAVQDHGDHTRAASVRPQPAQGVDVSRAPTACFHGRAPGKSAGTWRSQSQWRPSTENIASPPPTRHVRPPRVAGRGQGVLIFSASFKEAEMNMGSSSNRASGSAKSVGHDLASSVGHAIAQIKVRRPRRNDRPAPELGPQPRDVHRHIVGLRRALVAARQR
jgi:hypothetical protein